MADVFISYKHEDRPLAERFAAALEASGFSVWWDDAITPRLSWDQAIEREIAASLGVLVLWTPLSVGSGWVRNEAHYGHDRGKLVPVIAESCSPPLAFTLTQTLDLRDWGGDTEAPGWRKLLVWLADLRVAASAGPDGPSTSRDNQFRRILDRLPNGEPVYEGSFITPATPVGTLFADLASGPVMRVLPAGSAVIGGDPADPDRTVCEGPRKRIVFSTPLAMSIYPLTAAQYRSLGGETPAAGATEDALPRSRFLSLFAKRQSAGPIAPTIDPDLPVTQVSFAGAADAAQRLSVETGEYYRLPSEAEWEYACRAGCSTRYSCGDMLTSDQAWFVACRATGPVAPGRFPPNRFGLFDMHGNVREWTLDNWQESYDFTPADGHPYLDSRSSMRVVRGGSWSDEPCMLRSSARSRAAEAVRSPDIGFRLVREIRAS